MYTYTIMYMCIMYMYNAMYNVMYNVMYVTEHEKIAPVFQFTN